MLSPKVMRTGTGNNIFFIWPYQNRCVCLIKVAFLLMRDIFEYQTAVDLGHPADYRIRHLASIIF